MPKYFGVMIMFVLVLSGGCATQQYTPPTSGPTATLLFRSNSLRVHIFAEDDASCTSDREVGWVGRDVNSGQDLEVTTSGNLTVYFSLYASDGMYHCDASFEFLPEAQKNYFIRHYFGIPFCNIEIFEINEDQGQQTARSIPVKKICD